MGYGISDMGYRIWGGDEDEDEDEGRAEDYGL